MMHFIFRKSLFVAAVTAVTTSAVTSGCAPLIFGGALVAGGTTISSAVDRRSTGSQVNDGILGMRVRSEITRVLGAEANNHYTVTAYNGTVLLTGEMSTAEMKTIAVKTAQASLDVTRVIDELAVMEPVGITQRMSDSSLATRVRSNIVGNKNVSINQMKITVDRGIVYITGVLTPDENREVCQIAAKTNGALKVVSYVELMSAERIEKMKQEEAERQARLAKEEDSGNTK